MISILDVSFWLNLIYFFVAIFFAFFIPGHLLINRLRFSLFQRTIIGTVVGMVLLVWQGLVFGYLGLRWLSYGYLLFMFILWLRFVFHNGKFNILKSFSIKKIDWLLSIIIIFGILTQLSTVWFNGTIYLNGLYFCCSNINDTILHTALTNQLVKHVPPYEPGMFGTIVQNYHYLGNLVIAELIRIFRLPLILTQNQFSIMLLSLLLGFSGIVFSQIIGIGRIFTRWLVFFLYFGGDLVFLPVSIMRREINFNMGSLEDGAKFLVNPPRAFSIIIFFVGITFLTIWIKKRDKTSFFLTVILLGSLIGFKVYTGIFALSGLVILSGYFFIKKNYSILPLIVLVSIISAVIYLPVNKNAGGLYFTGTSLIENFIVQPWLMLDRLELARRIYLDHNSRLRVIQYELIFFFLFVFSIFGTKLIGVLQTKKSLSLIPKEIHVFLIGGIIVSAVVGLFFQQKTGGANTFNFLVSVFIIGSVYTALACQYIVQKVNSKIKYIIILCVILFTIPRVVYEGSMNINNILQQKGFLIEKNELEALSYIKNETPEDSLFLIDYRAFIVDGQTPYISFLSDRRMFLSGMEADLSTHGVDFSQRKKEADIILSSRNSVDIGNMLLKNRIDYMYTGSMGIATESAYFTQKVFSNPNVAIYKVSHNAIRSYIKNK